MPTAVLVGLPGGLQSAANRPNLNSSNCLVLRRGRAGKDLDRASPDRAPLHVAVDHLQSGLLGLLDSEALWRPGQRATVTLPGVTIVTVVSRCRARRPGPSYGRRGRARQRGPVFTEIERLVAASAATDGRHRDPQSPDLGP